MRLQIVHIITTLNVGGAELMLLRLTGSLPPHIEQRVISLGALGPVAQRLRDQGVDVESLGMEHAVPDPFAFFRLVRRLRQLRPNIVQTWLYHADLLGGLAARLAGCRRVVWNIRNSDLSPEKTKPVTRWIVAVLSRLSHCIPTMIVSCSEDALEVHSRLGYARQRLVVIPNGFDLSRFKPSTEARVWLREALGLTPQTPLIGLVARLDPQKNHAGFFEAAGQLHAIRPDVHFVLAGRGVDAGNADLVAMARAAGVADVTHFLGEREDVPAITAALDIASLVSSGEAFPNVLGEAMACGVPCVATRVGDAAIILGDTGRLVERGDMSAVAGAWRVLLDHAPEERAAMGALGRARILNHFELSRIAQRYADLYGDLVMKEPG